MSEKGPQSVTRRPEEILTTQEAEVLQKAEAGVLPCPWCGQMLREEMIVSGDFEGVLLSCPDRGGCGFRECMTQRGAGDRARFISPIGIPRSRSIGRKATGYAFTEPIRKSATVSEGMRLSSTSGSRV